MKDGSQRHHATESEAASTDESLSADAFLDSLRALEWTLTASDADTEADALALAFREYRAAWNDLARMAETGGFHEALSAGGSSGPISARELMALPRRLHRIDAPRDLALPTNVSRLMTSSLELLSALETLLLREQSEQSKLTRRVSVVGFVGWLALAFAMGSAWSRVVSPLARLRRRLDRDRDRDREHESGNGNAAADPPRGEIAFIDGAFAEAARARDAARREQSRLNAELLRARTNYASLFDNPVAGILRIDASGKPLQANRAFARILGYESPNELIENVDNVHESIFTDRAHATQFERLRCDAEPIEVETRVRRRDYRTIPVLESVRRSGNGYDFVVVDVTSLETARESLRDLSGKLLRSQDEERRRVARELHDSTGQLLAALEMNLGRLEELLPEVRQSVSSSVEIADECSRQLRSTSYLLHPPMLEEMGLAYALRSFVKGFSARSGIRTHLETRPPDFPRLAGDAELSLFRVSQEALTNVQRHSGSRDAVVRLCADGDTVRLEVEDHGRGIDERLTGEGGELDASNLGVGMRGMTERLRPFGGSLTARSEPGRTVIRAEITPTDGPNGA